MKITFVVPALNITGGLRVVSIYAELLAKKGHTVTVVSPNKKKIRLKTKLKAVFSRQKKTFKKGFNTIFFQNINYELKVLNKHRPVAVDDVPDADIVIATFWDTAEWVIEFSAIKGKKVYFIQHYESHHWLPVQRVEATYELPFNQIVVSQWIADILYEKYNKNDIPVVGNGVNPQQFFAEPRNKNKCFTVGVMYAGKSSFKGCDTSIASIRKARELIPSIKLISFSTKSPSESLPLPGNSKFYLQPKQDEIKNIYSECDVWLFGSRSEGFGLPILEAMACRTPVIGTKAGAAPELLKNGAGILVDIDDIDAMSQAIVKMARMDNDDWKKMSDKAFQVAKENPWSNKVDKFEKELLRIRNASEQNRDY